MKRHIPEVIEAIDGVGVRVGEKDGIDVTDAVLGEELHGRSEKALATVYEERPAGEGRSALSLGVDEAGAGPRARSRPGSSGRARHAAGSLDPAPLLRGSNKSSRFGSIRSSASDDGARVPADVLGTLRQEGRETRAARRERCGREVVDEAGKVRDSARGAYQTIEVTRIEERKDRTKGKGSRQGEARQRPSSLDDIGGIVKGRCLPVPRRMISSSVDMAGLKKETGEILSRGRRRGERSGEGSVNATRQSQTPPEESMTEGSVATEREKRRNSV